MNLTIWVKRLLGILRSPYSTTTATNLIVLVVGFIGSVIVSRAVGPEGRGEIAAVFLWPNLLVYFASFSIPDATLYFASRREKPANEIFTIAFLSSLLPSIGFGVVSYFLLPSLLTAQNAHVIELSRYMLVTIFPLMLASHIQNMLRANLDFRDFNLLSLFIPVTTTLGAVVLVIMDRVTVSSIVGVQLVFSILLALVGLFVLWARKIVTGFALSRSTFREMGVYGLKLYPGLVSSAGVNRLDQVLLAALVAPETLGLYVIAVKVGELTGLLERPFSNVLGPSVARQTDLAQAREVLQRVFRSFWLISILIKLAAIVTAPFLIPFVYGPEFSGAVLPAQILIAASLFQNARTVLAYAAQALNLPGFTSFVGFVGLIVTVVLLIVLIPAFSIMGAAIASLIAYFVGMCIIVLGLRRLKGVSLRGLFGLPFKLGDVLNAVR